MNMNAVGIDVSKGKSMVAILRPYGEIVSSPFEIHHFLCASHICFNTSGRSISCLVPRAIHLAA